jgi:DNA repair protein RecN (Recombination protein N)
VKNLFVRQVGLQLFNHALNVTETGQMRSLNFAEEAGNFTLPQAAMLSTLRIKNLALVSDLTLHLQPGYNAITGETGAGKSIIVGALHLLLGERADRDLIRSGSENCSVEAIFDRPTWRGLGPWLEQNGLEPCADDQLLLKRVLTAGGSNRQFVNGSPATLQVLAAIGRELVDMHGPHEHQSLLHPARQLDILDAFAGLNETRRKFAGLIQRRSELETEKAALIVDEQTYARQLDMLRFQTHEIAAAKVRADEEGLLTEELQRAGNATRLQELSQAALDLLGEQENSLLLQGGALGRTLQSLHRLDASAGSLTALQEQAMSSWNELSSGLRRYGEGIEADPARLRELEERYNALQSLKRKYGGTLQEVIAFGEEAQRKLQNLEQRDTELARINGGLQKLERELKTVGGELSARRREAIPKLVKAAAKQLQGLGFRQSHFEISIQTGATPDASGWDTIEFQFAPNAGEPARPLRSIASSGEMSRVMLALKTVLAEEDEIPLLVFDEIDANVGGETAVVVGEKMRQIARRHQVICITHLPTVAAAATAHYVVEKRVDAGRTISEITLLDDGQRVREIARMLGGQTETARRHAGELLDNARSPE